MTMYFEQATHLGGCGMGYVYDFTTDSNGWKTNIVDCGGTGFFTACFIPRPNCKEAYEHFCKQYRLVFQTQKRINENSDNYFFTAIFDRQKSERARRMMPTIEPKWFTSRQYKRSACNE